MTNNELWASLITLAVSVLYGVLLGLRGIYVRSWRYWAEWIPVWLGTMTLMHWLYP